MNEDDIDDMIARAERRRQRWRTLAFALSAVVATIGGTLVIVGDWFGWSLVTIGVCGVLAFGKVE